MDQLKIISGKISGAHKVVIYGPEGIGKSTLASHFPRPLYIDTEGSTKHLDVNRTERPTSWAMLMEQVRYVRNNPSVCSTLIIDTADWAEQLCISDVCAKRKVSGIEDFSYGKGYVYLAEEFGRLLNLLEEVVERGVNVVLTAHAKMRKFEQPDEMGAYDRWELKLQKQTAPLVKEWADMVLFANYKTMAVATDDKGKKFKAQGGRRVIYTSHHPCWDAKNRVGLKDEIPMDYSELARFFDIDATAAVAPPPASPSAPAPLPDPAPATASVVTTRAAPVPPPAAEDPSVAVSNEPTQGKTAETQTQPDGKKGHPSEALSALRDLMKANNVYDHEIQAAVAARGYFPEETPLENYPDDFIQGVLIGAWNQVHNWIQVNKPLPF